MCLLVCLAVFLAVLWFLAVVFLAGPALRLAGLADLAEDLAEILEPNWVPEPRQAD